MADEISYASLGDLTTTSILSGMYLRMAAERTALPNHPALMYDGDRRGAGSTAKKTPHIGLDGYVLPASATEFAAPSGNTALADSSTTVTTGRYIKVYTQTDVAKWTDATGLINSARFAQDAIVSHAQNLVALVADVIDGFTVTVGSSGVNATIQNWLDAKATLEAGNVEGPYLGVLHSRQWNDILNELLLTSGGAAQYIPATLDQIAMLGSGYKGQLAGVDVFVTNRVVTANAAADRAGGMFGRGAVIWGDLSVEAELPTQFALGGKILYELDRTPTQGLTGLVSTSHVGVSKGIDAHGVSIITDA